MKVPLAPLAVLLAAFLICCSAPHRGRDMQGQRPDDFGLEYQWREGTLPPPYHYEYSVAIKPSGQSQITFLPDYPWPGTPRWVESFVIEEERLDDLYRVMVEIGLFTRKWKENVDVPGGRYQALTVTAGGKRLVIKGHMFSKRETPAAQAMYAAVRLLVPKDVWEGLQARRQQYMQEHPRK